MKASLHKAQQRINADWIERYALHFLAYYWKGDAKTQLKYWERNLSLGFRLNSSLLAFAWGEAVKEVYFKDRLFFFSTAKLDKKYKLTKNVSNPERRTQWNPRKKSLPRLTARSISKSTSKSSKPSSTINAHPKGFSAYS